MDSERLTQDLTTATEEVCRALLMLSPAQADLTLWKAGELQRARDEHAATVNAATMAAYTLGALTGKNQAERDAQLTAFLAERGDVQAAEDDRRSAEIALANAEARLELIQADCKAATYRWHAAKAIVELRAAELRAMACQVPDLESANGMRF